MICLLMSQVHCECDEKKFKELNRTYCATKEGPYDTPNEIKSSVYTGSNYQISLNYAASFGPPDVAVYLENVILFFGGKADAKCCEGFQNKTIQPFALKCPVNIAFKTCRDHPKVFLHYYYIKNRAIKQVEHDLDTELLPKCSPEEQNPASIPE